MKLAKLKNHEKYIQTIAKKSAGDNFFVLTLNPKEFNKFVQNFHAKVTISEKLVDQFLFKVSENRQTKFVKALFGTLDIDTRHLFYSNNPVDNLKLVYVPSWSSYSLLPEIENWINNNNGIIDI